MADGRRRLWRPPAVLAGLTVATSMTYDAAPRAIATAVFPVFAACLLAGPALVYAAVRRRGGTARAAAAAALAVPLGWLAKECALVGRLFGAGPALYYALNPLACGLLVAAALQMAAAELVLGRRRGVHPRWPLVVVALVALAGLAYGVAARRYGVTVAFYAYVDGYRRLFGS